MEPDRAGHRIWVRGLLRPDLYHWRRHAGVTLAVRHGFTGTQTILLGQFSTAPLDGTINITASYWTLSFAALVSGGSGTTWYGYATVYLMNGSTNQVRTTILAGQVVGGSKSTLNSELTCFSSTLAAAAATVTAGDYLLIELGVQVTTTSTQLVLAQLSLPPGPRRAPRTGATATNAAARLLMSVANHFQQVFAVGPIGGHVGAITQLHVLDQSSDGAINQMIIARRNVPGLNGGMGEGDWAPCIDAQTGSTFGETTHR